MFQLILWLWVVQMPQKSAPILKPQRMSSNVKYSKDSIWGHDDDFE